ncbi:DUF402 domain-containing protein [Brachybacterium sp. AOP43-C2-M15]|uniref:DUF402 domain-containing protein n=1 Tax=Brachybacterium sp. AOP43-C2-M15 TaxID=3457661 RepID=UPI0040344339
MDIDVRNLLEAIPGPAGSVVETPHPVGSTVALRSIRGFADRSPAVSFAVAGTVLQDDGDVMVVTTRPGSGRASRAGRRTGPRGRNVVVTGWDGSYDIAGWEGRTVVRVHPRGRCWSVWRWHDGEDWTGDWYGNLEAPWRRSAVGYDTQDWALDVVARGTPGTHSWTVGFKDEDELDWYVEQGAFSPERAAYFRSVGAELAGILRRGEGPVVADWARWVPPAAVKPVPLPKGWQSLAE